MERKVVMSLEGQDGNAFVLLGAFSRAAKRQGRSRAEIDAVLAEAKSSDYAHLLQTLIDHVEEPEEL